MNKAICIALTMFLAGVSHAQELRPPACNSYVLQKTLNERPRDFSFKQRACTYGGSLISGQAFFGPIFMGGIAQLQNDPPEWAQGMKGYLRRVGTRYAQGTAKSTGEFVFSSVLHENPRYEPSHDKGFWKRLGHSLSTVVVTYHLSDSCNNSDDPDNLSTCPKWPAVSKMVGATSSGLVGLSWYPDRLNTPGQVLARTGSAYGGYVASAVFSEFQADIFRMFGKLFGSDRNYPAPPKPDKGAR